MFKFDSSKQIIMANILKNSLLKFVQHDKISKQSNITITIGEHQEAEDERDNEEQLNQNWSHWSFINISSFIAPSLNSHNILRSFEWISDSFNRWNISEHWNMMLFRILSNWRQWRQLQIKTNYHFKSQYNCYHQRKSITQQCVWYASAKSRIIDLFSIESCSKKEIEFLLRYQTNWFNIFKKNQIIT